MGRQFLDPKGQPVLLKEKLCHHGVYCDDRGNTPCEQCYENANTSMFILGHASVYEDLVKVFAERAGKAYAKGDDQEAQFFRALSKEMKPLGEKERDRREEHDQEHPHGPVDKKAS